MSDSDRIAELEKKVEALVDRLDWVMLNNSKIFRLLSAVIRRQGLDIKGLGGSAESPVKDLEAAYDRNNKMIDESFKEQGLRQ